MPTSRHYVQSYASNDVSDSILREIVVSGDSRCVSEVRPNAYLVESKDVEALSGLYVSKLYQSGDADEIIVLPRICLRIQSETGIDELLKKYEVPSVKVTNASGIYRVDCDVPASDDVLNIIDKISRDKMVVWCEPDMMSKWKPNNPHYPQQYYLKNTGLNGGTVGIDINAETAWSIVTGSPDITVAIVDDGVEHSHEDMSLCVLNGYTVGDATGDGSPVNYTEQKKAHGTACAGIIAAENNSIGIRGVASGVKILPVNISPYNSYYFASNSEIADAILWAYPHSDIMSCSWGGGTPSQVMTDAINEAKTYGRGGKGTIIVFASGNDASSTISYPASINNVISVGAIDKNGNRCNYSNYGSNLTMVAFGGYSDIVTTDRMGVRGYTTSGDWNYTTSFGGTSAACPQVAGVAALMLSVNPNLTANEITKILTSTARKLPNYTYTNGKNVETGYGLVDAATAVSMVASHTISGPTVPALDSEYYVTNLHGSGFTVAWSFTATTGTLTFSQSGNTCTLSNAAKDYVKGTLTANVYYGGSCIKTLTKTIDSAANFHGTYSQEGGQVISIVDGTSYYDPIPTTYFGDNGSVEFHKQLTATISSPLFATSFLHRTNGNAFPTTWHHNGSTVTYNPPRNEPAFMFIQGEGINTYDVYRFNVYLAPEPVPGGTKIDLACGDGTLTINLVNDATKSESNGDHGSGVSDTNDVRHNDDMDAYKSGLVWHVAISNIQTGYVAFTGTVVGSSPTISTADWPSGIYAVSADVEGVRLSGKVMIR